jgi:hypothetical protein
MRRLLPGPQAGRRAFGNVEFELATRAMLGRSQLRS